jgi:hypothetical protein
MKKSSANPRGWGEAMAGLRCRRQGCSDSGLQETRAWRRSSHWPAFTRSWTSGLALPGARVLETRPVDNVTRYRSATVAGLHGLSRCRGWYEKERADARLAARAHATGLWKIFHPGAGLPFNGL